MNVRDGQRRRSRAKVCGRPKSRTHHAPRLPTPHAPTAQFAATATSLQGLSAPPPRNDPLRPALEKMKRIAPTETPATIPNRREYRAQGMSGNRCRSESGSMVRTASRTVAFCGCGVASAGEAEASGCCNELAIPSTASRCLTIGTAQRWACKMRGGQVAFTPQGCRVGRSGIQTPGACARVFFARSDGNGSFRDVVAHRQIRRSCKISLCPRLMMMITSILLPTLRLCNRMGHQIIEHAQVTAPDVGSAQTGQFRGAEVDLSLRSFRWQTDPAIGLPQAGTPSKAH